MHVCVYTLVYILNCVKIFLVNLRYFLIESKPKVIFTDLDKTPCILKIAEIMNISTKIVIFEEEEKKKGKAKRRNKFISMESILNSGFKKTEINKFSCIELTSSKDTAMIIFASGVTGTIPKDVVIPYAFFTAPSSQETPIMVSDDVGLWVTSLGWNINLLLIVRAILSYVKAIKFHGLFDTDDGSLLCYLIEKYKVIKDNKCQSLVEEIKYLCIPFFSGNLDIS